MIEQTSSQSAAQLIPLLDAIIAGFDAVGMANDKNKARQLKQMLLSDDPATVVVLGEFNAGKSTLVNALSGASILPVGIIPTTATVNILSYSDQPRVLVLHRNGQEQELPFAPDVLQQYTAKNGDQFDIREIQIQTPTAPKGLILMDTPGVNDINQSRAEIVYDAIPMAHTIIFVMDIQQALKKSEVDFLRDRVLGHSLVKTLFVLNHVDRVKSSTEVESAIKYVTDGVSKIYHEAADRLSRAGASNLADTIDKYANNIPVYAVSAKLKLRTVQGSVEQTHESTFWKEVERIGNPLERNKSINDAVRAQSFFLLLKLRDAVASEITSQRASREQLQDIVRSEMQTLRATAKACRSALNKVTECRARLVSEIDRAIDAIFEEAKATFANESGSLGIESIVEKIRRTIARRTETHAESLSQSIKELAAKCSSEMSAQFALAYEIPSIKWESADTDPSKQKDLFPSFLRDPKNQTGIWVAAAVAGALFGWIGLAVAAGPLLAGLFGSSDHKPTVDIDSELAKNSKQLKANLKASVISRLDLLTASIPDALDGSQIRIRSACNSLCQETDPRHLEESWSCQIEDLLEQCRQLRV